MPCAAGSLALLLMLVFGQSGAVEVEVRGELVAVRAEQEPLRDVLEAIAGRCGLEIRSNGPASTLVTVSIGLRPLPHVLRSLLRDESYILRYSGDGSAARSLWLLAPADDGGTESTWSVGAARHPIDVLVRDLADPDEEVRVEAVLALGGIGSRDVEPFLVQSLADSSADVREAVFAVLEDMDIDILEAGPRGLAEPGAD